MSKILITGGTGLVGQHLTAELLKRGHEVVYLSHRSSHTAGVKTYKWNIPGGSLDPMAFAGVNNVIHLAGAPIAGKRWTTSYKKEMYESRVHSTRLLVNFIHQNNIQLDGFVCASAVGIYGNDTRLLTTEEANPGTDFLANLCREWESEAQQLKNTRLVILRTGVILAKEAGFIPAVSNTIRFGLGAVLGKGAQYMSWIHIADLTALYLNAVSDPAMNGVYNAVSPEPETNRTITRSIAKAMKRPLLLPAVPVIALRIIFGELSSTLLANQHISSAKTQQTGFRFLYPHLRNAVNNLL